MKGLRSQKARWLEQLQEFDVNIVHRQGKRYANVDSLSRRQCHQCGRQSHGLEVPVAATSLSGRQVISKLQKEDDTLKPVIQAIQGGERSSAANIKEFSRETRWLFQLCDQLTFRGDTLYRLYETKKGTPGVFFFCVIPSNHALEIHYQRSHHTTWKEPGRCAHSKWLIFAIILSLV